MMLCAKQKVRSYLIRSTDGMLWDKTQWRTFKSVLERRIRDSVRWKKRYSKNKSLFNKKRIERFQNNKDQEYQLKREWYKINHERERFKEIERRIKRNPTHGLFSAINEYRSGRIGIDELDRRINQAVERTHEIYIKDSAGGRKPV